MRKCQKSPNLALKETCSMAKEAYSKGKRDLF
jgi:hypothetical protein